MGVKIIVNDVASQSVGIKWRYKNHKATFVSMPGNFDHNVATFWRGLRLPNQPEVEVLNGTVDGSKFVKRIVPKSKEIVKTATEQVTYTTTLAPSIENNAVENEPTTDPVCDYPACGTGSIVVDEEPSVPEVPGDNVDTTTTKRKVNRKAV